MSDIFKGVMHNRRGQLKAQGPHASPSSTNPVHLLILNVNKFQNIIKHRNMTLRISACQSELCTGKEASKHEKLKFLQNNLCNGTCFILLQALGRFKL